MLHLLHDTSFQSIEMHPPTNHQSHHPHHHHHYSKRIPAKQYSLDMKDNLNDNINTCDTKGFPSAMDASVSNHNRDLIRSSDSSVPNKSSLQYKPLNKSSEKDAKRCQNNKDVSHALIYENAQNDSNTDSATCISSSKISNLQNIEIKNNTNSHVENSYNPNVSNNKINHYHKIHKNVRNRARKFDNDRTSKSAFLGGLFTDLTASEDTLLLENGEVHPMSPIKVNTLSGTDKMVHPMCERSKLSSNDPTIKMPSIFGSISNVNNNNHNNNNSALMSDSPVASGAISKHNRPIRKSVNIQSPVKELDRKNEHPKTTTDKERPQKDNSNRQNTEVPIARPRIGIEKSLTAPTKGKKGPQVRNTKMM